jgi:spoIIIJ-associated protein
MSEMERTVKTTGAGVEEAIAAGLEELQVDQDAVDIEILDEGSRGVFGLGARDARVRLTIKPKPVPQPTVAQPAPLTAEPEAVEAAPEIDEAEKSEAELARGALLELLTMMGIKDSRVDVRKAEAAPGERETPLVLDVRGPDVSVLIGHRGETLAALQRITRLIVGQETAGRTNLVIDVDGYKAQREESLRRLAERLAEQAVRTNRRVVLEPMPPHERRIVHLALRDRQTVTTESIGEGDRRKVTIIPQNQ